MTNTTDATGTTTTDIAEIVDRYLAVWSFADADDRAEAVAGLWTADGVEYIEGKQFRGHAELTDRVTEAHEAFVGNGAYTATGGDDATRHGDVVTFTIRLDHATGPAGDTAWSARVFLVLAEDGRVREDYQLTVQPLAAV
ncbi:MAG: hypothetical protein HOV83_12900 [Catenulispora sp.]|nr:hypothetical protein [Catenulispora sp.]